MNILKGIQRRKKKEKMTISFNCILYVYFYLREVLATCLQALRYAIHHFALS